MKKKNPESTKMLELVDNGIKTIIITFVYMFKKVKTWKIFKRLIKFLDMKTAIYGVKNTLDEINSRWLRKK